MSDHEVQQVCTFFVDRYFFGVDVAEVREVIRCQPMTRVPGAPGAVSGLINLRGQIVTAVDLRRRLDLPARRADSEPMNVVVRSDDGVLSFLVDEIGDVIEVDPAALERPPETVTGPAREMIRAIHKMPERLLLILDTETAGLTANGTDATRSEASQAH